MSAHPSLLRGDETLSELHRLIAHYSRQCPFATAAPACDSQPYSTCPFRMLRLLTEQTRTTIIARLCRPACLALFELEREVRETAFGSQPSPCPAPPPDQAPH